ncbi:STY0301 family protein [Pseudoduganella aquatica]|nr:STY0301 family protein [Pseudoduganella aquatica]
MRAAAFAVAWTGLSAVHAEGIVCPQTIMVTSSAPTVREWQPAGGRHEHTLENAQIFSGHPSEEAALVPDEASSKTTLTARWQLPPEAQQGYWISCSYRDTALTMVRKLDRKYSTCMIRYKRNKGPPPGRLQTIECS